MKMILVVVVKILHSANGLLGSFRFLFSLFTYLFIYLFIYLLFLAIFVLKR